MIHDENEYHFLRRQIPSKVNYNQINSTIHQLVKAKLLKRQQKKKCIIVHYTYERRFVHCKSKIHQIWNQSFRYTSAMETKVIIGTRNNPNLTKELVCRSPQQDKQKSQHHQQQLQ